MPRTKSDSFKRNVKFYNENFDLDTKVAEGKLPSFSSYAEALQALGNDENAAKEAIESAVRAKLIADAVAKVSGGMEEKYIMAFIKPMRNMTPFDKIEKETEQTAAILAQVKTVPFLLEGLKSYCKNRAEEGDESED